MDDRERAVNPRLERQLINDDLPKQHRRATQEEDGRSFNATL